MTTLYILLFLITGAALAVLLTPVWENKKLCAVIAAGFFVAAFGLYHLLGAPEIISLMQAREVKLAGLKEVIVRRSDEVKADPNNLAAWVELGESFMETGQFSAAANAFKQAVLISRGHPTLIMAYAKALIAEADGKVTDDAKKALEMVVLQEPKNDEARYWLIVRQLQEGKTGAAMKAMKKLYHSLPDDSPLKAKINAQIGKSGSE